MEKTIITIYGRKNEGKSETIKNVCKIILSNFPRAIANISIIDIDYNNDILIVIQIGEIKIGIESQGDPETRMLHDDESIESFAKNSCDIILCASRTSGNTVNRIDHIAKKYHYGTIWKSSYYAPNYNHNVINRIAAEEIVNLIKSIIVDEI